MKFQLVLARQPRNYVRHLQPDQRSRVLDRLAQIEVDPFSIATSKPLHGSELRSARVGDLRILFKVEGEQVHVLAIGTRGDIYRTL